MAQIGLDVYLDNVTVLSVELETDLNGTVDYPLDTRTLTATLTPYIAVFRDLNTNDYQMRRIYLMTPVMLRALEELRTFLDRLNRKMRIDSLKFSDTDYVAWLQAGRDHFNSFGKQTDISMTNAQSAIYSYWLKCSMIMALRVKYLEEGLTSFDYTGSAVQLNTDVTQYVESLLGQLNDDIENNLRPFKEQLYRNGANVGDGSAVIRAGYAKGATGLTMSPVTGAGYLRNR